MSTATLEAPPEQPVVTQLPRQEIVCPSNGGIVYSFSEATAPATKRIWGQQLEPIARANDGRVILMPDFVTLDTATQEQLAVALAPLVKDEKELVARWKSGLQEVTALLTGQPEAAKFDGEADLVELIKACVRRWVHDDAARAKRTMTVGEAKKGKV